MALVRYTPKSTFASWPELDLFSNRLSRVFGNAWDTPEPTGTWIPAVNVEESADELLLTAELPGMREEDVNVDIENNILTIRGEKREAYRAGGEAGARREARRETRSATTTSRSAGMEASTGPSPCRGRSSPMRSRLSSTAGSSPYGCRRPPRRRAAPSRSPRTRSKDEVKTK